MISRHISDREGVYSITAIRLDLDNTPTKTHLNNMKELAEQVFEPLREWVGGPIRVNSFYRGKELNKAIGGSSKSQHCKGQAMDIDDTKCHKTNAEMFRFIRDELEFDQLIWEFGDDDNPNWLHVSYVNEIDNRNRCLRAYRDKGKTKYKVI
jgi:hypothetical protein